MIHLLAGGRFDTQPQVRGIAVGAADTELLHFEAAARFDHFVEDLLHDVRIDQVAFGLDDFFKWHETTSLLVSPQRAGRGPQYPKATAWLPVATRAPFCGVLLLPERRTAAVRAR